MTYDLPKLRERFPEYFKENELQRLWTVMSAALSLDIGDDGIDVDMVGTWKHGPLVGRQRIVLVAEQAHAHALVLARLVRLVARRARLVAHARSPCRRPGTRSARTRRATAPAAMLGARQQALEAQRQVGDEVDDAVLGAGELVERDRGARRAAESSVGPRAASRRSTSWFTDSPGTT